MRNYGREEIVSGKGERQKNQGVKGEREETERERERERERENERD